MSNDSTEPSRASDPELMRLSKARPPSGDLDFTRFAPKKSGAAPSKSSVYDTSRYTEQLRVEDPWPDEDAFQDRHETKVTLLACDITTPAADLKFDRPALPGRRPSRHLVDRIRTQISGDRFRPPRAQGRAAPP